MKAKVKSEFRAIPKGKKNNFKYDIEHVFEVMFENDGSILLKDIHGGRDLQVTKERFNLMIRDDLIKVSGRKPLKLQKK